MKQDEVLFRLKSIIHGNQHYTTWTVSTPHLVQLVNSAIEMEREANAKVCEELEYIEDDGSVLTGEFWAKAIRARGEQE